MASPANMIASGSILPSSFVKVDTTANNSVVACSAATDKPFGIAQESTDAAPVPSLSGTQYAAVSGENIRIYQNGDTCLLTIGSGGCTAGDELTPDANGAGVTAGTGNRVGAIATQTVAAGGLCRVRVTDPYKLP